MKLTLAASCRLPVSDACAVTTGKGRAGSQAIRLQELLKKLGLRVISPDALGR